MEGKEVRFGIANSALWATATTAASNGSVNAMHDSFTPLGGLVPMWLMQLGEVVFGGVGSGLYGMLVFAIIAVFVAGLMVGRTPEYLGKKIEAFEMKMASLVILIPPASCCSGTALAVVSAGRARRRRQPRARTASARSSTPSRSAGNNNGSAFAGLGANTPFYNIALGARDARSRATGSRSRCSRSPARWRGRSSSRRAPARCRRTRRSSSSLLVGVVLIVGALTFIPALALGPIVEHLLMPTAP